MPMRSEAFLYPLDPLINQQERHVAQGRINHFDMFSKLVDETDESGAPVLDENDIVQKIDVNNYKFWGSYQ